MKVIYAIYQELKKILTNYTFFLAVLATAIVNTSGTIVTEAVTSKTYNLFQFMLMSGEKRKEIAEMYNVTFSRIFISGSQGYMWMFASIFASAPFVILMCSAKKNNNIRFEIYRLGKKAYVISKGVAAVLAGALVIMLGYGIYALILKAVLPAGEVVSFVMATKRLLEMMIYGMSSVVFTFILSGIMRNKYLVLCIPFMINYFIKGILEKPNLIESKLTKIAYPMNPSHLFLYEKSQMIEIVLFWIVMLFSGFLIYYFVLDRRCDCGE